MAWLGATGEQAQQTATKPERRPARTKPPSPQQFRAVDRRQPEPAGDTRRYEYPGAELSGDRSN